MTSFPTPSWIRSIFFAFLVMGWLPQSALALGAYGTAVDVDCPTTMPYDALKDAGSPLQECTLCHDSNYPVSFPNGGNVRAAEKASWDNQTLTDFCPVANTAPVINPAIGAKMVTAGQQLSFNVNAQDVDAADTLTWTLQNGPAGASLTNGANGVAAFAWTPNAGDVGVHNVTFMVSDDAVPAGSAMEIVAITVVAANQAPVLGAIGNQSVNEGETLAFTVAANDPDVGDTVTLTVANLPTGATFTAGTGAFSWSPNFAQSGNFSVTFTATDSGNPALSDSETIVISVGEVNRPPTLNPIGNQGVNEAEALNLQITSSDPDGDGLTLTATGLPNGSTFTPNGGNGTFSWTPGFGETGTYNVTFTVTDDGVPPAAAMETIVISVGDVNRAPTLTPIGNQTVNEGMALAFTVTAADADGDMVTISSANLPMGATLTPSGAGMSDFAWTPAFNQGGNHTVTFTATDNGNPSLNSSETLTISVGDLNRPPVLGAIGDTTVNEGEMVQIAITSTDPDGDSLTLQLANQPQGAALQDNGDGTGTFAWTPGFGEAGNYSVTVSATDDGTPVAMDQETFMITVGDVNRPPALAPIGNKAANTNQLLTFDISGSDPDGDNVTCSVTGNPAGSTFTDNANGTGTFSWMPGDADVGSHTMTFTAADAGNPMLSVTETITVAVGLVNNMPTLVQIGDRTVLQGQTLSFSLLATDPDGNALTFTAANAPAGATLTNNNDGTASFVWTPGATQVGAVNVTFTVTDDGIPPMTDEEVVKLSIQGAGGGGFGASDATWWETWGGNLSVTGNGATPLSMVEILDADTGTVLGQVTADANGDFQTGECRSYSQRYKRKGKRRWRTITIQECLVPVQAPCEIQVRMGTTTSLRVPVNNAPAECGMAATDLIDGSAFYSVSKKKKRKRGRVRTLSVMGQNLPPMAEVEIRDAGTDTVLETAMADASGRLSWSVTNPAAVPCFIRLASMDHFSSEIPVMHQPRKKRGKRNRRGPAVPLCAAPPSFPPPGPTTVTGGGGGVAGGGGVIGGGGGNNGGGNNGGGNNGGGNNGGGNNGGGNNGGGNVDQANIDAFNQTVYPLTSMYCIGCHSGAPGSLGSPDIANPTLESAYTAVWVGQKVNLTQPIASRLVQRLSTGHGCWSDMCNDDAETMRASIAMWALLVGGGGSTNNQESITSANQTMADGIEGGGNTRFDDAVIARWEFQEGAGDVAADSSGVAPAMDLALAGTTWLGGGGIKNVSGGGVAGPGTAIKLHNLIANSDTGSGAYSIEAWVATDDVMQRGPARIVSYSRDTGARNFTMGQQQYSYSYRNRSRANGVGGNGTPSLETDDDDRLVKPELTHVVMTYDPTNGRKIFVNGQYSGDADTKVQGNLALDNWDPSHSFLIGNELTGNRLWKGDIRFVAIHNRALNDAEIASHHLAGNGSSLLLRFDVAQWTGEPGSVIELSVSEFDAYSYLFSRPTYVGTTGAGIPIRNLRVMVNGQVPIAGQAFRNVDTVVTQSPQQLSPLASVISKNQGPEADVFSIAFEVLGDNQAVVVDINSPVTPGGFLDEGNPDAGLRNFSQINQTMSQLTGVSTQDRNVERTFATLTQQLPGGNDLRSFVSSHQVGSFKLAIEYCDRMVETRSLREAIFGTGFNFNNRTYTAFQDPNAAPLISDRLVEKFYGTGLANQPTAEQARPAVTQLITDLTAQCTNDNACDREHTQSVVKAACTAVLSSAPVLFH